MTAKVPVGPAVKAAITHRRHEVGHEIVAQMVSLVDGGPEHTRARVIREAHRIAKAAGKHAMAGSIRVVFVDGAASRIALGRHVRGRSDRDVQLCPLRIEDQVARPVVVAPCLVEIDTQAVGGVLIERRVAWRQVDDLLASTVGGQLSRGIRESHHRIVVADIEIALPHREPEGPIQFGRKGRARLGHTVAIRVPQNRDSGRAPERLGEDHVAVRRQCHEARKLQLVGKDVDGEPCGHTQSLSLRHRHHARGLPVPRRRKRRRKLLESQRQNRIAARAPLITARLLALNELVRCQVRRASYRLSMIDFAVMSFSATVPQPTIASRSSVLRISSTRSTPA